MATATVTPAQAELISSLTADEIPIKLRCAICSKLAVNAFRLPCCEQAICETCQSSLPSSCPVCEHEPLAAQDCTPHKSLRTTIKVFLRTEEKKREALKAKVAKEETPVTPIEPIPTPAMPEAGVEAPAPAEDEEKHHDTHAQVAEQEADPSVNIKDATIKEEQSMEENLQDIPHESVEVRIHPRGHKNFHDTNNQQEIPAGQEKADDGTTNVEDTAADGEATIEGGNDATDAANAAAMGSGMPGFDPSTMMGGFPGMGMGEMNPAMQMQMMMAMQSGMAPGFGGFPMMGKSTTWITAVS
jgi:hypothetical protein